MGGSGNEGNDIDQENRDLIQRLTPMHDIFMRCLFQDNLPLAQTVLRILTNIRDLKLIRAETQRDLVRLAGARSVCLDVYGEDSSGRKYDLEVQRENVGADPKRARYYSAALDVENLSSGEDFRKLPETYVIIITQRDYYREGKALYPIERVNLATQQLFSEGAHILYVNGSYEGDDELGRLMHDFRCENPDEMYFDVLAERTRKLKESPEGRKFMDDILEKFRKEAWEKGKTAGEAEGKAEGKAEGMAAGKADSIRNLMKTMNWSAEQAMKALLIPEDQQGTYWQLLQK